MTFRRVAASDVILTVAAVLLVAWVIGRDLRAERRQIRADGPLPTPGWEAALTIGVESGNRQSSVKVVEFLDLECPACAHYHAGALARFLSHRDAADVSFVTVHFPLPIHPNAERAAIAAECASQQGAFRRFVELALARQSQFESAPWPALAAESGVRDSAQFDRCLSDPAVRARVVAGRELARRLGVTGTPTLLVNGNRFRSPPSTDALLRAVNVAPKPE